MACLAFSLNHRLSLLRALDLIDLGGIRVYRRSSGCLIILLWEILNIVVTSTTRITEPSSLLRLELLDSLKSRSHQFPLHIYRIQPHILNGLVVLLELQKPIPTVIEILLIDVLLVEPLNKELPSDLLGRSS
ncbi:hypothetical protein V6N12_062125 [Hibiscus sabdariffa]|uniref:Uncharacterized protein n=1 Tax=Hibiscus sabdariffa TaxID=183260 RepID=A0ABR2F7X0_9ROSI